LAKQASPSPKVRQSVAPVVRKKPIHVHDHVHVNVDVDVIVHVLVVGRAAQVLCRSSGTANRITLEGQMK
jgi:hypothetical protein